ncbi:MAG TPA: SpoIIE family protein phosphatase [Acidimicrobiales bacterium]
MTSLHRDLADEYRAALLGYVAAPDELGRARAYELGHRAVEAGMGLIELVGVHRIAVDEVVDETPTRARVAAAMDFLTESLSTFEMAQRGYREAQERAAVAHDIALTLQRSLLPAELADLPGVERAVRYLPAGPQVEVGGDWYDVVPLDGGRVGLVVGDVMGHGVHQAAVMGQMRLGVRAYLLEGHAMDDAVSRTDSLLLSLGGLQTATMVVGVVDVGAATFRLVNAGHPPPVLVERGGSASFVVGGHGRLLGLPVAADRPVLGPVPFPAGACLLMYTDGLLEGEERAGGDGLDRLLATVAGFEGSPDELCDHVIAALVDDAPGDDICLLAVRLVGCRSRG